MKKTKRLLAIVLSAVILATSLYVGAYASVNVDEDCIPTIVVPGLFQSETKYYEDGKVVSTAEPFFIDTNEVIGEALSEALIPIASMIANQEDKDAMAANAVADVLSKALFEKHKSDENGKLVNDIRATKYDVSYAELSEHDRESIFDHFPLQYYVEKAGEDKLYVFSYVSTGNMIDTANELYDFIQHVKEDSGYDKVNIVPVSQGGSIANALLQIYADNGISVSRDINRIVYVVPALNGSTLVGEVYEYGLLDDDYELYCDMLPALLGEENILSYVINVVLRIMPNADLNNILDQVANTLIMDYTRYSTLLWGLCPAENYPGSRDKYLTDESTKEILRQTEWFYHSQLNRFDNILNAIDDGVEVFNIVDYNVPLFHIVDSWDDINADGIIQLESTSMGAFSLGVDVKLPEDYVPTHSNCTDPSHDHTDPYGIIDVCTGLLPETTFYFYGQSHESSASNDVIMKLASTLMFDSSFRDVHTYPARFPQFNNARNTKDLMKDLEEAKRIDMSTLSNEDKAELLAAIVQVEKMLDNTVIDLEEVSEANDRFYSIYDKITAPEAEPGEKGNTAYMDFGDTFKDLFRLLSEILYMFFGGSGFGEM